VSSGQDKTYTRSRAVNETIRNALGRSRHAPDDWDKVRPQSLARLFINNLSLLRLRHGTVGYIGSWKLRRENNWARLELSRRRNISSGRPRKGTKDATGTRYI